MKRDIKFRAWDVANNEMIYFGAFQFEQFPKMPLGPQDLRQRIFPFDGIESGEMVTKDVLNGWYLMQYTGLKDSKGVEIYEGDIILCEAYQREIYDVIKFGEKIVVEFKDGYFYPFGYNCGWRSGVHSMEVIGNIYESPGLLQKS